MKARESQTARPGALQLCCGNGYGSIPPALSFFQQEDSLWFTAAHAPGEKTTTAAVLLYEGSKRAE